MQPRSVPSLVNKWTAPPLGVVKLNADASLAVDGWIGLGVVARNSHCGVLFAATRRVRAFWAPEVAEAKAIALAVKLGARYGFHEVIVESDCQMVVNRLLENAFFLYDLDFILSDIISTSLSFSSLSWAHVKRDGNFVAHHLVSLSLLVVNKCGRTMLLWRWLLMYLWTLCPYINIAWLSPKKKN